MKARIVIPAVIGAMLGGCAGWSKTDTIAEAGFAAATTVDGLQSVGITHGCAEANPVIGPCGERVPLGIYMPSMVVLHAAVSALLPRGAWRRGWQMATLGVEGGAAYSNYLLGWGPGLARAEAPTLQRHR